MQLRTFYFTTFALLLQLSSAIEVLQSYKWLILQYPTRLCKVYLMHFPLFDNYTRWYHELSKFNVELSSQKIFFNHFLDCPSIWALLLINEECIQQWITVKSALRHSIVVSQNKSGETFLPFLMKNVRSHRFVRCWLGEALTSQRKDDDESSSSFILPSTVTRTMKRRILHFHISFDVSSKEKKMEGPVVTVSKEGLAF